MRTLLEPLMPLDAILAASPAVTAAELNIAAMTDISTDPLYQWTDSNLLYYLNMYGTLTKMTIDRN
jgi:hypothetical protein